MSWKLLDIFEFISPRLSSTVSGQDIEYAAINGLLRVLDPHSILLTPSVYREMKLGTTGKFGGLGIVITQRDGRLVIQSVMEGTPARSAGLKSGDIITQIGAESTVNMSLNEAVKRLRGEAGTIATLWIDRKSTAEPVKYEVKRANITLASVTSKLLEGGVGYAHIKNFQQNTADDLRAALIRMASERSQTSDAPLAGLILDLRDNPGGLLDQAIAVSNLFVTDGTIVTTVGSGNKVREEKVASPGDTWDELPVAVLVNQGSAAASERVAGALRNHDRALIVGAQTFGKGSVQVIYDIEKAALKLTVAQYLTPGDESIQSVGITPHFALAPVAVDKERVHLNIQEAKGEVALENHLSNQRTIQHQPLTTLGYLVDGNDDSDFATELAKRVLAAHGDVSAKTMAKTSKKTLDLLRNQETARIVRALGTLNIDWNTGRNPKHPRLKTQIRTSTKSLEAGSKVSLTMTVENTGKSSVFRVRGRSASATAAFDGLDFPIGHIPAGETRRFTQTVRTSRSMPSELVDITTTVYVGERQKPANTEAVATLQVTGLDRPRFGYTVHVLDHEGGNGDGRISKDESVTLRLRITNVGLGKAHKTLAALKNRGSEAVFVTHGREWIKELEPGKASVVDFKLQVRGDLPVSGLKLDLQVTDTVLRQRMTHALQLPTTTTPFGTLVRRPSQWVVDKATPYLDSASASAKRLGEMPKAEPLFSDARVGDWLRIPVNTWDYVWVSRADLIEAPPGVKVPQKKTVELPLAITQPNIALDESPRLETTQRKLRLKGLASFSQGQSSLPDLYIFRDKNKVFFRRASKDRAESITFDTEIPLSPGRNVISIHARAGRDLLFKQRLTVQRRP